MGDGTRLGSPETSTTEKRRKSSSRKILLNANQVL
jgi:hypothetical protein